ncbi:LOW QUALITY PROTEIN: hypothetical protein V2J09_013331, partial [Rumex salicifolius]
SFVSPSHSPIFSFLLLSPFTPSFFRLPLFTPSRRLRSKVGQPVYFLPGDLHKRPTFSFHQHFWRLHRRSSRHSPISAASDFPRDYDGACLQMRLSYSPCAHLFLFLWTDCNLAGALGLLRILIYEAYDSGNTTLSIYERKAVRGITEIEDRKQREVCATKFKRQDGMDKGKLTEVEQEREEECGICMEVTTKFVLPNCSHALCIKCYRNW